VSPVALLGSGVAQLAPCGVIVSVGAVLVSSAPLRHRAGWQARSVPRCYRVRVLGPIHSFSFIYWLKLCVVAVCRLWHEWHKPRPCLGSLGSKPRATNSRRVKGK
jgi:hypothetical protein